MSVKIYMPFYIGDYLRETQDLSTEEHGAYFLLLFCFWNAGGKVPDNDKAFASITRLDLSIWQTEMRPRLERFFSVKGGYWTHKRILKELADAKRISEARSYAGRLGGRPKKQKESKSQARHAANPIQTAKPSVSSSPSPKGPESRAPDQ